MKLSAKVLVATALSLVAGSAFPREASLGTESPSSNIPSLPTDGLREVPAGLLARLEASLADRDCQVSAVSQVAVSWHLDHTLKVINEVYKEMEASNPDDYRWSFKLMRSIVFATGKIGRGRGKAPAVVLPPEKILLADLQEQLEAARENWRRVDELPERSHFMHQVFGQLKRDHAKRFLDIHTEHHLLIIDDIVRECRPAEGQPAPG